MKTIDLANPRTEPAYKVRAITKPSFGWNRPGGCASKGGCVVAESAWYSPSWGHPYPVEDEMKMDYPNCEIQTIWRNLPQDGSFRF